MSDRETRSAPRLRPGRVLRARRFGRRISFKTRSRGERGVATREGHVQGRSIERLERSDGRQGSLRPAAAAAAESDVVHDGLN